ncbi:MAG: beta-N-acetylhexosaminidase [Clostridium sp.]|uniref:beta-N-acetylhexosaminidase n=1 Tax=Clostridium sp. TaxID=1506 RepID=UPI001D273420|nr:beta-N-acetylhexosaminidase [Clostridium sp.]MBS5125525.1 beta-N-acetylhexosaminidase [Clostridium sp.]
MERLIFMLKKRFLLLFLVFLLTGCGYKKDNEINNSITNDEKENINGTDEIMREEKEPIDDKINSMTLDEKIGQMIITGFNGSEYNDDMDRLINEYKVGGVILFARNIEDSNQMIDLTRALQENNNNLPLFISIDEEGGRVSRLPDDVEKFPSAFTIGLINNQQTAYENGKEIGYTLKRLGINLDYAPVLDIYSNENNTVIGDRAFSKEESIVSTMGIATMEGIEDADIIPVVKHFPGHGDTEVDSHYGLPIVYKTLEELRNFEFIPFVKAIESGCDVIMVSHIILNEVDSSNPASLSKIVISDLLRKDLEFDKVVITDDMSMGAITSIMSIEEACIKSIEAGCDILLLGNAYEEIEQVINSIKLKLYNGEISEEQINKSVKRILELKKKYNMME